ncbi:ATP-binding protein [Sphingopyxis terrae]|uniref:ATP-binding protein n=1 Tax=Sphingopyxis terrae TaxID=33052 RepID=UPI000788F4A8|nr:ATP-binding protein [Sphingopyxis terrae]
MTAVRGLGRQILLSMLATTLGGVVASVVGLYGFYAVVLSVAPQLMPDDDSWWPSNPEWLAIGAISLVGAAVAARAAVRLTRQILTPLNSVATSAREIAHGHLAARAVAGERTLGEAAALIGDFNRMAANLEKASAGVAHWNAMIAHELRTPVTILRGRLQGLADGVFEPDPALFRSLQLQAEGLARLVEDLRTVSLVDSGRLELIRSDIDMAEELGAVLDLMRPGLEAAGFSLAAELEPGIFHADPVRIRQALMALLDNAERHATPGRLRVILSLNHRRALIEVVDEGPGLSPELAEEAFTPFRRYPRPDSPHMGSGLGLAVVRAIARAHGGDATYKARNGGACFCLELPRHQAAV